MDEAAIAKMAESCWRMLIPTELHNCDFCGTTKNCTFTDDPMKKDGINNWYCRTCFMEKA